MDAVGMGLGYTWVLLVLGLVRETLGFGTILGVHVMPKIYNPLVVMVLPAGAFILLGILVAIMNKVEQE
jgi:electron transport complex protein RnfE